MATGINPFAKGMSFRMPGIKAYLFDNDITTMTSTAASLLLSNHSYGTLAGWYQDTGGSWYYYGNNGDSADYKFGDYDSYAASWDNIAYIAPYYLIVKASGNNRNVNGPAIGGTYFYYDSNGNKQQATRKAGISNNDSYYTISTSGNAKNIMTVGAVDGIQNGYRQPSDVIMTSFSSWGPTDDGRIKPDIVADGVNVLSCSAASDSAYATLSGTSMATPNVTGSLMLLQDLYSELNNGAFMRSATLKGVAIHTANEAGNTPGPDYQFGWGLLNVAKAGSVIKNAVSSGNAASSSDLLYENLLKDGQPYTLNVVASGKSPITATISWTDPEGTVVNSNILFNHNIELVNDLDIRITKGGTTYYPWVLNQNVPSAAATKGDNYLDNVEKIEIDSVVPGQVYTITVSNKGTLQGGSQAYSLLVSGVGGTQYCSLNQAAANGASIDSVSFGSIANRKKTGCGSYNDFTNMSTTIKTGKTMQIHINVGSCDGLAHNKIVNVYIDYNENGSFSDSGELVATGSVTGINNTFTANITPPNNLTVGSSTLMRIVATDSTNATVLSPCTNYIAGETQDYLVTIAPPDNDIALTSVLSPTSGDYSASSQLVTVQLTNNGTATQQNVALTALVKKGKAVVATLNGTYPSPILADATVSYTFQTPIATLPDSTYTITATATIPVDNNPANNTISQQFTIAQALTATANSCNGTVNLKVATPSGATNYAWFDKTTATTPVATGSVASLQNASADSTVYLATGTDASVGPATKGSYTGGYQANGNNYLNYTSTVPVVLTSARLYTRHPGTITIMAADITNATPSGSYYYKVLNAKTIDVYATNPSPISGSVSGNDPNDAGAEFYINMPLPAGQHSIIVSATDATIYRSNGLPASGYPYSIPGIFTITGNSASNSNPSDTVTYKSYYYYLYDMKIKTQDCVGDRIPVPVVTSPLPVVSISKDTLISSVSMGNQWYLNGQAIVGATGKTYIPTTTAGSYSVIVIDSFGCERQSNYFSIDKITPIAGPNPNKGIFNLGFYVPASTDLAISLIDAAGHRVYIKQYKAYQGSFSDQIDVANLASGVYILQVQHGSEQERKKVIIAH